MEKYIGLSKSKMGSSKMENFFGSLPSESGPEESLSELLAVFFLEVLEVCQ
jgi:hypothetical protein